MDDLTQITALMAENRESVGFIPMTTVAGRYLAQDQYIMQRDMRGRKIGYLLHGKPTPGGILTVAQHCIEYDQRLRGYGRETFGELVERARQANCRAIKVRCAANLPSMEFWRAMGCEITRTLQHLDTYRQRDIYVLMLDLWPRLI